MILFLLKKIKIMATYNIKSQWRNNCFNPFSEVKALAGGFNYQASEFNRVTQARNRLISNLLFMQQH